MSAVWEELKRRKVVRIAVAYAIAGWLLIEIASTVLPTFEAPLWVLKTVTLIIILGFPVALILSWGFDLTSKGIERTGPDSKEGVSFTGGRKVELAVIGALVLGLTLVALDQYVFEEPPDSNILPNSIAVLPFENLSPDPDNAYFAAGIHESTLNQLAKIHDLTVIARTSVLQYSESPPPIPEIAKALRVKMVMEGSVRYANGRVLITAQLIDGQTGGHLWSREYDRDLTDVFAVQSDIATKIASAMKAQLLPSERQSIERQPTTSADAYALYLRARVVRPNLGPSGIMDYHKLLDRAIDLDPDFALAHGLKAASYAFSIRSGGPPLSSTEFPSLPDREAIARASATKSLALDPDIGMAHMALALLHEDHFEFDEAHAAYERAVQLAPSDADILDDYMRLSSYTGDHDKAIQLARRLLDLDPDRNVMGQTLLWAGRVDEAAVVIEMLLESNPDSPSLIRRLAEIELVRGNRTRALSLMRRAEELYLGSDFGAAALSGVAYAYGRLDRPNDAIRVFRQLEELAKDRLVLPRDWAMANLGVGNNAEALRLLNELVVSGRIGGRLSYIALDPFSDPVLSQPEFLEVRRKFGFIE